MTTYTLPADIDRTGNTDVAAAVNAWLANIYPIAGDVIVGDGILSGSKVIELGNPKVVTRGVRYDFGNAVIVRPAVDQTLKKATAVVHAVNLHECDVTIGTIRGANPAHQDAVKAGLEAWSGLTVGGGCVDFDAHVGVIEDTWGDFVFVAGGPNARVRLEVGNARGGGRHAVSSRTCRGLQIIDSTFANFRHLFFDHEAADGDALTDLEIGGCTAPAGGLGLFCQVRPLKLTDCGNLWIHDHLLTGGHYHMSFEHISGVQRQGLRLERLKTVSTSAPAVNMPLITIGSAYAGWDHVTVTDVHDRVVNPTKAVHISSLCTDVELELSGITT